MLIYALAFPSDSDREKFELIFRKYKNLMLYKAFEILKDPYLAEDAVSEAFLRIHKNMRKISDPLSNQSVAFFVTITKNSALTMYKKAANEYNEKAEVIDMEYIPDVGMDPENQVISDMAADDIYMLVDRLSDNQKQVFLLKYAHDCSIREISRILDMTEGNVTVTLHRARNSLKKMLRREEYIVNGHSV